MNHPRNDHRNPDTCCYSNKDSSGQFPVYGCTLVSMTYDSYYEPCNDIPVCPIEFKKRKAMKDRGIITDEEMAEKVREVHE